MVYFFLFRRDPLTLGSRLSMIRSSTIGGALLFALSALQNEKRSSVGVDPLIDPIDNPVKNEIFPDKHVLFHIFIRELC